MSKVIVIRGNSGSGKSTVARKLQGVLSPHPFLIEQDHFRRKIVKEKETEAIISNELMYRAAEFAIEQDRNVIIEGIFPFKHRHDKYIRLFERLQELQNTEVYFVWFDIPFEETLKRHITKSNSHEFGEIELKHWWKDDDRTGYFNELTIDHQSTVDESVESILKHAKLI